MGKSGMSAFLATIFFIVSIDVTSQTPVCTKHLKIEESTQRNWNPGVVKENSAQAGGDIFEVKIKVKKGGYITFEKLIIEDQALAVEVKQDGNRGAQGPFKKGDEIILTSRTDKEEPFNKADQAIVTTINNKNAIGAVLYTVKGKEYIHTISNFTVRKNGKATQ
jgi:hypothetical protein